MSLKYNFEYYNKNNVQEIKLLNEDSYTIPMLLFDKNLFPNLSRGAIFLYSVLLDEMNTSEENNRDYKGRLFVKFHIEKISELINVDAKKIINDLNELKSIGLVEFESLVVNENIIIYVKNFTVKGNVGENNG